MSHRVRSRTDTRTTWPALDGVRALAIALVIAYHLGHLSSGWIGVDVFFVLSGFLITTLLLAEYRRAGRIRLRAFWARRAKRLLPAVMLLLVGVGIYAWVGGPGIVGAQLRAPALATLFYGANWQQLAVSHNYFNQFSAPDPLTHTWSLAIEEQYYIVWPILLVSLFALTRRLSKAGSSPPTPPRASAQPLSARRSRRAERFTGRRLLIGVTTVLMVASVVWMAVAAHLWGANRAYLGTDTRAWELLLGGLGAMIWPPPTEDRPVRRRPSWSALALLGAAGFGIVLGFAGTTSAGASPPSWIWSGGLFAAGACVLIMMVGSVRAPGALLARLFSLPPVRWLGWISYSLYLWHWPVITFMTGDTTGLSGATLLICRLAAMLVAACLSYYVVESPLRRADWSQWWRRSLVPIGVAATGAVILAGTVVPPIAGTGAAISRGPLPLQVLAEDPLLTTHSPASQLVAAEAAAGLSGHGHAVATGSVPRVPEASMRIPGLPLPASTANPLRVWIFGDSVIQDSSLGLIAALQATHEVNVVANSSFGGWGLTTDHSWASDFQQLIAQYHPQIAIGSWSWDDQLATSNPADYTRLLRSALSTILAPGDGVDLVILLQYPQPGPDTNISDPSARRQHWIETVGEQDNWNRIASQVVKDFPGHALYLHTDALFAPGGRFVTWMRTPSGAWLRARKLDNAHMCPYGAALFGQLLVNELTPLLGLGPLQPGWQNGSWTKDPRYNDPPGACPADQPPPHYRGVPVPSALR